MIIEFKLSLFHLANIPILNIPQDKEIDLFNSMAS